jgi:A/G-specific adenine glycosylase
MALPGIGKATACAISAFAFNEPVVFVETNIRSVFIHAFFPERNNVTDKEVLGLVEKTLDAPNPRQWYWALMDYGAMLKEVGENPNRRSANYYKQTPSKGSNRQIRGMILKALSNTPRMSVGEMVDRVEAAPERTRANLIKLEEEGLITKSRGRFTLA